MISKLAQKIKDAAYLEGNFVLRSGKNSKYYIDKYLFETKYDILDELTDAFAEKISQTYTNYQKIAAPELGAIAIASLTGVKLKKDLIFIRKSQKDYGTSQRIEGSIEGVKSVILIEDILTTGGAAINSAIALRELGVEVQAIIGTIDRLQGAQENIEKEGFKYDTLFTINDLGI